MPGGYDPAHGGVPIIPDPTASAWQAIGGDLSSLPQLFTLGNAYNLFNFGQQQQTLQGTPSYEKVLDLMAGKYSQEYKNMLAQAGAERGVAGGQPMTDSPNSNAAYLRALGLLPEQLQAIGQQQYGALAGHYPMGAPFNLNEFLTTPEQQQAANAAANTNAAAPNPAQAAAAEQAALLAAIAAGKGSVPPGGGAPGIPNLSGGGAGSLSGPAAQNAPGQVVANGPPNTINRGTGSTLGPPNQSVIDQIQAAIQQYGPNPYQGPAIHPSTGGASGGYQGPAINPWSGGASGGYQGPAVDPWTGQASGGYQGPGIDPWSGLTEQWWNNPENLFPFEDQYGQAPSSPTDWSYDPGSMTPSSQSDWWNAPDPWAALTGTDFTAPDMGMGDLGGEQIPDWASLPGEDYYGG